MILVWHRPARMQERVYPYRIGADENGLGPRLGPMIVTAALARIEPHAWDKVGKRPRGALAKRLGDSKALSSHGNTALAEAWARAVVAREGRPALTPADLVETLSLDSERVLREPCPKRAEAQCHQPLSPRFEAEDKLVRTVSKDLDRLAERGIHVVAVRSVIVCAKRLNVALDAGRTRFAVDLHEMERLILSMRERLDGELLAVCGKVGGYGKYEEAFGPLGGRLCTTLEERRACSRYRFPGVGELAFVQDADATDQLVALASLVGKYLRELLMARIVSFYQAEQPELGECSGYHDPVTTRFVKATALTRGAKGIPDDCFTRRAMEPAKPAKSPASRKTTKGATSTKPRTRAKTAKRPKARALSARS